jgi:MerR family redox-sensitive transcriptional activator SoxR
VLSNPDDVFGERRTGSRLMAERAGAEATPKPRERHRGPARECEPGQPQEAVGDCR